LVACAVNASFERVSLKSAARDTAALCLPLVVIGGALAGYKLGYYGSLFPATYYAKSALDAHYSQGALYVGLYFFKHWPMTLALIALPALLWRARVAGWSRDAFELVVLAASGGLFLLYVMHSGGDFMFARRVVPAVPFVLLAIEALLCRIGGVGATVLAGVLAALSFTPRRLYPENTPLRIHGISNERAFYPPETMALRAVQGEIAGAVLANLPVKAAFAGGMCVFGYHSKLPYLVEPNGLTNMELARAPLSQRGAIMGHEKGPSLATLRQMGVTLMFQKSDVPPGAPAHDQLFFGDRLVAELLRYDRALMSSLESSPQVRFKRIEDTLAEAAATIRAAPCAEARRTFSSLDDFYLGSDPAARDRLAKLVATRCRER
jgi:hypothetical protein